MSHMSSHALHPAHIAILNSQHRLPAVARLAVAFAVTVTKWDIRRRSRKTLGALAPHELHDIGLTVYSAQAEAAKPFWQD